MSWLVFCSSGIYRTNLVLLQAKIVTNNTLFAISYYGVLTLKYAIQFLNNYGNFKVKSMVFTIHSELGDVMNYWKNVSKIYMSKCIWISFCYCS